jgi:hypothetical protein
MGTHTSIWQYRPEVGDLDLESTDLTGFEVEALDGGIGKIDAATRDVARSEIVIDTGPWIFGKKVILPAGVVDRIDTTEERVFVGRTKEQIKAAPELDEQAVVDDAYRDKLGSFYGPDGVGRGDEHRHL